MAYLNDLAAADVPAHIHLLVKTNQWKGLIQALDDGLPANVVVEDMPLLEYVAQAMELRRTRYQLDVPAAPLELLDAFIRNGLEKAEMDDDGTTAVGLACLCGQWQWAKHLVEAGFCVESKQPYTVQTLSLLLLGRFRRMVVEREDNTHDEPEESSGVGQTQGNVHPLTPGDATRVRRRKVAVDSPAEQGRVMEIICFLAQHGACVDLPSVPDITEWDDQFDEADVAADYLLAMEEAEPEIEDEGEPHPGDAPLFQAIRALDEVAVEALLAAGASLTASMGEVIPGGRPLEFAIYRDSSKIVQLLLQAGAPTGKDPHLSEAFARGQQPLVLAAHLGRDRLIPWLLEAMESDEVGEAAKLAMQLATAYDRVDCMKTLHLLGVPLDITSDTDGYTLLHRAAEAGSGGAVEYLLEAGLDWKTLSENGVSAAEVLLRNHPDLARIYGVDQLVPVNNVRVLGRRKGS